ncbi:MAG: polyketide cyclase [Labilithrix sp.]|nr:polyketide cyclase [Labilithrix sp.]
MTKASFVYVTYILSTPEKVYDALLDPEMTKQFWGWHKNVSDWEAGSEWRHVDYDDDGKVALVGTVVEVERPRLLALTWQQPGATAPASRVTFELATFEDSVKLTVSHTELDPESPMYRGISQGWPAILSSLKTLLETGKPLPSTARRWPRG